MNKLAIYCQDTQVIRIHIYYFQLIKWFPAHIPKYLKLWFSAGGIQPAMALICAAPRTFSYLPSVVLGPGRKGLGMGTDLGAGSLWGSADVALSALREIFEALKLRHKMLLPFALQHSPLSHVTVAVATSASPCLWSLDPAHCSVLSSRELRAQCLVLGGSTDDRRRRFCLRRFCSCGIF